MDDYYYAFNNVYLKSFEYLEKMNVEKNIQIVKNEINSSSDELVSYCYDWGCWDHTYLFAQGLDENYIETNSVDAFDILEYALFGNVDTHVHPNPTINTTIPKIMVSFVSSKIAVSGTVSVGI